MRWDCRERYPRHWLQRKQLVSDPGMHLGTCVTHVPRCMSGSPTRVGGENVPGIPGANRNFMYLARGSWICIVLCCVALIRASALSTITIIVGVYFPHEMVNTLLYFYFSYHIIIFVVVVAIMLIDVPWYTYYHTRYNVIQAIIILIMLMIMITITKCKTDCAIYASMCHHLNNILDRLAPGMIYIYINVYVYAYLNDSAMSKQNLKLSNWQQLILT